MVQHSKLDEHDSTCKLRHHCRVTVTSRCKRSALSLSKQGGQTKMGLTGGAIAGIVIGACVAAVLIGLLGEAGWA